MKSYILVQLADGTYKNVDTQDIEQIFKNHLGGETVIFKDELGIKWGIKSEKLMVSSSSNPISNKEMEGLKYKYDTDEILSPDEEVIHDQNKMIERLQEQLTEANKLIKDFHEMHEFNKSVIEYLKKWSVK